MSAGFTPGPWSIKTYGGDRMCNVRGPDDEPVAQVGWMPDTGDARMMADARLIAAAPELYEALARLLPADMCDPDELIDAQDAARAALAKVRGQQ